MDSHHFESKTLPFISFKILYKRRMKITEIGNKTNINTKTMVYLCAIVWRCLHDPLFSCFIIIPTCESQKDRLTHDDSIILRYIITILRTKVTVLKLESTYVKSSWLKRITCRKWKESNLFLEKIMKSEPC